MQGSLLCSLEMPASLGQNLPAPHIGLEDGGDNFPTVAPKPVD